MTVAADMYWVGLVGFNSALRFRGDYFGRADVFASSGYVSGILNSASRGRVVFVKYDTPFPNDMSDFSLGTGQNQIQFLGGWACANFVLRK